MVAELLRLRLQSIANEVRTGPRRYFRAVLGVLVVLVLSVVLAALASELRRAPAAELRAVLVGGGSLLVLAWWLLPFGRVRPAWADPRRLATLGVPEGGAALGLAAGQALGLPVLALVVLSTGYVRAWEGEGVVGLAVLAALLAGATAALGALVASTVTTVVLRASTARRLLGVGVVALVVLGVTVVVDVARSAGGEGRATVADALAWTPLGAALALPGHAVDGATGRVVSDLVVAVLTLLVLGLAWRALVARAFLDAPRADVVGAPVPLGWFDVVRAGPVGAVAARSLTYWVRDARYRISLVVIPFLPLLVLPLGIAGVDWHWLALVPVPLMCLLLGFLPHNDVAYDSTALWMHVAAHTHGLADRVGRIVPPLLLGVPVALGGSAVATWLHGDPDAFGAELGLSVCLLLTGLGLASIVSAALPYAAVRPHDDPFQQPQSTGSTSGWAQSTMVGGALLLSAPTAWLAVRGVVDGAAGGTGAALWTGLATGVVVLVVGVLVGARVFTRRAPELLAFTLRS